MQSIKRKFIALTLLVASSSVWAAAADVLLANKWSLVILQNVPIIMDKFPNEKPYLQFAASGTFTASAACNTINGSYTVTDPNLLSFSAVTTTPATTPCTQDAQDLEQRFIAVLPNVATWSTVDNSLNLINADGTTVAILVSVEPY